MHYQAAINLEPDFNNRVKLAAAKFKQYNRKENATFCLIKTALDAMCAGARRCMYCEDSAADEVEHHRPKALYPECVFDWLNYLYSCGPCNGPKKSHFALFRNGAVVDRVWAPSGSTTPPWVGNPVLLDPRSDNPLDYLMLDIAGGTFLFVPTIASPSLEFSRADYTIKLLRLNERDYLPRARREAYNNYTAHDLAYGRNRDHGADSGSLD